MSTVTLRNYHSNSITKLEGTPMELEGDELMVAALQRDVEVHNGPFGHILHDARQVLKSSLYWKVMFSRRGMNKVTHRFARLSLTLDNQVT